MGCLRKRDVPGPGRPNGRLSAKGSEMFEETEQLFLGVATILTVSQMFAGLSHARLSYRWRGVVFLSTLGQVAALGVVGCFHGVASSSANTAQINTSALMGAFALALWSLAAATAAAWSPTTLTRRALGILGVISFGCLVCLLLPAQPWSALLPLAGRAATAVAHEPVDLSRVALYAGSTGLAVPFATAVAALFEDACDNSWARNAFGWSLASWAWLGLAMALAVGSTPHPQGVAPLELSEPAQRAALLEWVASVALLCLLRLAVRRGTCSGWAQLLATIIFPASCLGFLLMPIRIPGGALPPYAIDPVGGLLALALARVLFSGALVLYAWKRVVRDLV